MMSTDGKLSVIALLVQPELMRKSWYRTCCQYGILSKLSEDHQQELWNTINTIRGSISQEYLDTVNDFFRSQMMQILADNEKAKQERMERSPVQASKEPEVKLSFFDKLR